MVKRSWSGSQQPEISQKPEHRRRLSGSSSNSLNANSQRSPDDAQSSGKDNSPPSVTSNGMRHGSNEFSGNGRGVPISKIIHTASASAGIDDGDMVPVTTRKSTACPACRKQKVR